MTTRLTQMNVMQTSRPTSSSRCLRVLGSAALKTLSALLAAVPARALPAPAHAAVTPPDTIRGIVFDSLMHAPIEGASVQGDPGGATTMTDREGRFTLASPDTIRQVTVFHELLDRSGLGSLVARITSTTPRSMLVLSTPSFATIWSRLCPDKALDKGHAGIVFGVTRTADARTRVAGALVRVSWEQEVKSASTPSPARPATARGVGTIPIEIGGGRGRTAIPVPRISDAKTDSTGTYYACGTPPSFSVYVAAYSSTLRSGGVVIQGDSLPLRRVDLVLGEDGKTSTIRGVVRDPAHAPIPSATVEVDGTTAITRTNAEGRFTLTGIPTGSRTLVVHALPFSPMMMPVDVVEKEGDAVQVDMVRQVTLPSVSVTGRQNLALVKLDYEQRRREGFGTFRDSTEIIKATSIRSVFQGIPSLTIAGKDQSAFYLFGPTQSMGGDPAAGCHLNVYIDGVLADEAVLISLSKELIAAVEVYIRQEFAPAKYLLLNNNCGIVLVWTKLEFNK
jgi:hypothetical protein